MSTDSDTNKTLSDFEAIRLSVASPEKIKSLSYGEVIKSETVNYRTSKPEKDGLFCERIFGPTKTINPNDARFKGVRSRDMAVDKKGRIVTNANARRERMGHIELAVPVVHSWFLRSNPSVISYVLGMSSKSLERVIYFSAYMILGVNEVALDAAYADLDSSLESRKSEIEQKYETLSSEDTADIKALAKERSKEIDQANEAYLLAKSQLDGFNIRGLITESDYLELPEEYRSIVEVGMGAEAVHGALKSVDLATMIDELSKEAEDAQGLRYKKIVKRLKIIEGLHSADIKPEWLCLTVVPVIPPELRPMVPLAGGRFATSDINDLYRRVINRNNRLKKLSSLGAPELIKRNEKRMLQESVDALIDNASRGQRAVTAAGGRRKLKSLTDVLKGKQGRLRGNLLGKRVDYSGRSVIVSGPELDIDECGLPREMALELFKAHIIGWLIENEYAQNIRAAGRLIEIRDGAIWDALDKVMEGKYVLLNRAPTLHRLGIQAFKPKLTNGKAIQLHPLVCVAFNADFDGDQMAVHLPLGEEAQKEAREIMAANLNVLKPANGSMILGVSQDMVLGCYFLTYIKPEFKESKAQPPIIADIREAENAYSKGIIKLQQPIITSVDGQRIQTTYGRILFNLILPEDFAFVNDDVGSKAIKKILAEVFESYGSEAAAAAADKVKDLGFKWATRSGLSTSASDYTDISNMDEILGEAEDKAKAIQAQFEDGLLTNTERRRHVIEAWKDADRQVSAEIEEQFKRVDTSMELAAVSGARGSTVNFKMVTGIKGVVTDALGREVELPIRSNYKKGFNPIEYFIDSSAARKGLIDTALKTADSGYLTRRMVDVAQEMYTVEPEGEEHDPGFEVFKAEMIAAGVPFSERIFGRFSAEQIKLSDGKELVKAGELITRKMARQIEEDDSIQSIKICSVLTSNNLRGVTVKSYGVDLAYDQVVKPGQAVGVIAAQSMGENTTQLTLNTKHQAGSATESDVTKGLPRVDELLEARVPKGRATLTELDGEVAIWDDETTATIQVTPKEARQESFDLEGRVVRVANETDVLAGDVLASEEDNTKQLTAPFAGKIEIVGDKLTITASNKGVKKYTVAKSTKLNVENGDLVQAGDQLTEGSVDPHELLNLKGPEAAQRYLVNETLKLYASQGVDINVKHIELIVRQMFSRVRVEDPGDSLYVVGDTISRAVVMEENTKLLAVGKRPIPYTQLLLGITRASVASESFLAAASFQETTRVLVGAAITGKKDGLRGLKENVIIGRTIPVGTGYRPENQKVDL